jgi:hypothetical protein
MAPCRRRRLDGAAEAPSEFYQSGLGAMMVVAAVLPVRKPGSDWRDCAGLSPGAARDDMLGPHRQVDSLLEYTLSRESQLGSVMSSDLARAMYCTELVHLEVGVSPEHCADGLGLPEQYMFDPAPIIA